MREQYDGEARLANGLGWLSLALGAVEMAVPDRVAAFTGIPLNGTARGTLRAFGAREVANGAAILASEPRPLWVWARVAGDLLDLAALGAAMDDEGADRLKLGLATASVAGVLAADVACAVQLTRHSSSSGETSSTVRVSKTFTINRDLDAVYSAWRDRDELPEVLRYLRSVDAAVTEDVPNTRLAWRSSGRTLNGRTSGSVTFRRAPGDRGTELRVDIEYTPLAGRTGNAIARLLRAAPEQQIQEDLRRLKQLLETGEIARAVPSSAGAGTESVLPPGPLPPDCGRELAGQGARS